VDKIKTKFIQISTYETIEDLFQDLLDNYRKEFINFIVTGGLVSKGSTRTASSWRYNTMKKYRRRAEKFKNRATTQEEILAWDKVLHWFDCIINRNRFLNKNGSIGLRP